MVRTESLKFLGNGIPDGWQFHIQGFAPSNKKRTNLVWEDPLVIENVLRPVHQSVDVVRRSKLGGPLVLDAVFPEVFVPETTFICWSLQLHYLV